MKYKIEYTVADAIFHNMVECENVVEADSLPKAIKEIIDLAKRMNQKMLGITNYYWLED